MVRTAADAAHILEVMVRSQPHPKSSLKMSWRYFAIAAALVVQLIVIIKVSSLGPEEPAPAAPERVPAAAEPPAATPAQPHDPSATPGGELALSVDSYTGDLDGMIKRRHVRVLTTFNRTNFFLAGGRQQGFEYSLLRDYEKTLNKGRGARDLKVHLEFIPVARDELIPKLLAGEGDIAAAGLTITPARLEEVAFTTPYLEGVSEVIVLNERVKDIETIDDLAGREVHVRRSSSYYESLQALNAKLSEKGLKPVRVVTVDEGLETEYVLDLVSAGALDITVADSHLAAIWAGVLDDIVVREDLAVREGGRIAWMVRKNSPGLTGSLNAFIRTRKKGTKFGNIYFNRFFRDNKWIARPLAEDERRKMERYRSLFEKYSQRYGIPWLLTAAVAFQESGFDQSKRSRAGAVGVMQVLPSTAADKNIGVSGVDALENNIHAGVKYLAFLRNRYFDDPEMNQSSQLHFVLASYNAGPANVRRARQKAPSWSVDPDRWFKNVEVVMLRTVGQEPVQYVVNINRYYLLFDQYFRTLDLRSAARGKGASP
jgi:membrane-bound lytic murein transglycosylase MltF